MEREAREDERAKLLRKCCAGRLGAEEPEGRREGEAHCSVTPAPEGVCSHTPAHTHSHTLARARARAGTSASLGRAERTSPTPAAAPRPRATPPTPHPAKAIGRRGGAAPGERAAKTTLPAARLKSRATLEGAQRVEGPRQGGALGHQRPGWDSGRPWTCRRVRWRWREAAGAAARKPRWGGEPAASAPLLTG